MTRIKWAIGLFALILVLAFLPGPIMLPSPLAPTAMVFASDKADLLDLETPTAEQLKALPGIG